MRISDWSSDVCSSDLQSRAVAHQAFERFLHQPLALGVERRGRFVEQQDRRITQQRARDRDPLALPDRKSVEEGKSVSVRVDLGGRRILKKKRQIILT